MQGLDCVVLQATEVQWSDQEASFARDAFKQMNKSINRSKCVVDTHISGDNPMQQIMNSFHVSIASAYA